MTFSLLCQSPNFSLFIYLIIKDEEQQPKSHNSRQKRSQASFCRQTEADCFPGCVLTERLISREWQSGLFEVSHKQSSEREYIRLCEVVSSSPLLSCIPLLSDRQTHLVDQNNSTITWRAKSSQNPVFCISHGKALGMITEKLRLCSEWNTSILCSIH